VFRGARASTKHHGQGSEKFIARAAQKFILSVKPARGHGLLCFALGSGLSLGFAPWCVV
jgi:hypothetical protein